MELTAIISIGVLVAIQIIAFAFGYGALSQSVKDIRQMLRDLMHRIERIENGGGKA